MYETVSNKPTATNKQTQTTKTFVKQIKMLISIPLLKTVNCQIKNHNELLVLVSIYNSKLYYHPAF